MQQQDFSNEYAWKKFHTQNFNNSTRKNILSKLVDLGILLLPGTSRSRKNILSKLVDPGKIYYQNFDLVKMSKRVQIFTRH